MKKSWATLNFVAYKVYKELERFLKLKQSELSPQKVIEIAQNIHQLEAQLEDSIKHRHILTIDDEQKMLAKLFEF